MDLSQFLPDTLPIDLFIKVVFLIFIGFMVIYALMLLSQVRSFSRVVSLRPAMISAVPAILAVAYLIASLSLFVLAIAIL